MDDLDEEVEQLQRGRRTRPLVHDHLRKVHVIRIRTVAVGPAVPPHVSPKGLARREAQPTCAARVGRHGLGPVALRHRRRAPEVARPVAAERLERREPPPARPALKQLPPAPATTLIAARRRRRACGCRCCFVV